eukprot:7148696-Prymnesium_polylepis.1
MSPQFARESCVKRELSCVRSLYSHHALPQARDTNVLLNAPIGHHTNGNDPNAIAIPAANRPRHSTTASRVQSARVNL